MKSFDVVVVGAGVSGAYTAWRLMESLGGAGRQPRVGLYEMSGRIGGRLFSHRLPGMPHVWAELGGMRYSPRAHRFVASLVDHLKLPARDFPMGNPNPAIGSNDNLFYLRRTLLRASQITDPSAVPYKLRFTERGMTPSDLQAFVMNLLVPNAAKLTLEEWFQVKVFGQELYKYGFWDLLYRVVSSEAFAYFKEAGAYDTNVSNCNAVKGLPNIVTGSVDYQTLVDGFDKLPMALVDRFRASGGEPVTGARLLRIRPAGELQELTFSGAPPVTASHVVLAMPRHALEQIEWPGFEAPEVRAMIGSVIKQPAFKMFLGYEYPWWRPLGLTAGRSITDMPVRQCFYFGTEAEQPGADKENLNSLLMATYNDVESVPYWRGFENDPPFRGRLPRRTEPGQRSSEAPAGNEATEGMVRAAQQQLAEMHGLRELPAPYAAAYQDWTRDPYGAAWHVWKAGFKYNELMPRVRRPVPEAPVYICGEAYSNDQGWVEGALQTAERMLEEHFQTKRPGWLPADYDMGP